MSGKLVTVATFSTLWEAEMACSRLDAEGIPSFVKDGHTINMNWLYSNALGGVKVQVPEEALNQAEQTLYAPCQWALQGEEDAGSPVPCPRCGNDSVEYRVAGRRWAFLTWVLCGLPLIWPRKRLYCSRCGYKWNESRAE